MSDGQSRKDISDFRRDIRNIRRAATVLVAGMVIAAFYFAQELFLPITLAVVLTLVLRPVARALRRCGIHAAASAALIVLFMGGAVGTALYFASDPASQWLSQAPRIGFEIQHKFRNLLQSANAIGEVGEQVKEIAEGRQEQNVQEVVVREPGLLTRAASGGANVFAGLVLCMVLLYFLLATADQLLERLVQLRPRLRDKVRAVKLARDIEADISRYLFTVTLVNFGLGCAIALGMLAAGMPNAFLWGGMAALLNFIPYLGSFIGAGVVFAVSAVTFPVPLEIITPPLIYLALTTFEGQFVTPTVLGKRLDINPVALLVGVAFLGWLWGVVGAFMAAPIVVAIKVCVDHIEGWESASAILSSRNLDRKSTAAGNASKDR